MINNYIKFVWIVISYLVCIVSNAQDLPFIGDINQFKNLKEKENISKILFKNSYGTNKEYIFDKGNLIKEITSLSKTQNSTTIYSYDSIGRLINQKKSYGDILFSYKNNKLKQVNSSDSDLNISFYYNNMGFPQLIEIKDPDNFSPYKMELSYNRIGLVLKQTSYENDNFISIENYEYYDNGLIKSLYRKNNKKIEYPIIILGSSRKINSEELYFYQFDSRGNWIKKIYIYNNEVFNVDERNIFYDK